MIGFHDKGKMIQIKIKSDSGFLPEYETEGSAGMDVKGIYKRTDQIKAGSYKELGKTRCQRKND